MESGDLERIAESAYETPGVPTKVARELGIEVRWVPHLRMLGASGKLAGRTIIAVRSSLSFMCCDVAEMSRGNPEALGQLGGGAVGAGSGHRSQLLPDVLLHHFRALSCHALEVSLRKL